MSDLDEMQALCRMLDENTEFPTSAATVKVLARFVLRALPVLRWAEQWRDETCSRMPDCDPHEGTHDQHCELTKNERAGAEAVDAFRGGDK